MRNFVVSVLTAGVLMAAVLPLAARAEEKKEIKLVAVASLAGFDSVMADIELMCELSDQEHVARFAKVMHHVVSNSKFLSGLDQQRPWGVLIGTDGEDVGGCAFVPVNDLKKIMSMAKWFAKGKIEEHEGGIYEIEGGHKTLYVQETHKGWAFLVDDPEIFHYVPKDPAAALGGLNEQYDAAMRIYPANIPAHHREKMRAKMQECCQKGMSRHKDDNKHRQVIREIMAKHSRQQWATLCDDMESITVGWSLDEDVHQGILEVTLVAKEGSKTAKFVSGADQVRTAFGGFTLDDALIEARATGRHVPLAPAELKKVIAAIQAMAYERIEHKAKNDTEAAVGKRLVDGLLGVAAKTCRSGHIDGAIALRVEEDATTLIHGRHIADGAKLEATIKEFIAAVRKKHAEKVDKVLTLDAAKYRGVNFHVVSFPIPEKCKRREQVIQAVGERMTIVLGIADEAVYLAAGRDAMKSLKQAIAASEVAENWTVPPLAVTMSVEEWAEWATQCPVEKVNTKAEEALKLLDKADDADAVRIVAIPVDNGLKFSLQIEEGVLRLMAAKHRGRIGNRKGYKHHEGNESEAKKCPLGANKCPADAKKCPVDDKKCPADAKKCPAADKKECSGGDQEEGR